MKKLILIALVVTLHSPVTFASLDRVTKSQVEAAQGLIQYFGYSCDNLYSMNPFVLSKGFNVLCLTADAKTIYHYELTDKGGRWQVEVK